MASSAFDKLFTKSVPHLHEKIFLSKDYTSYKACMKVIKSVPGWWSKVAVYFRTSSRGQKRRVLGGGQDSLKEVKGKIKKHRRAQQRVKFIYAKFAR